MTRIGNGLAFSLTRISGCITAGLFLEGIVDVENAAAARPPQNSRARCRAIALHQPAAGVLTIRCVVDARADDVEHLDRAELIFVRHDGSDGR